MIRTPLYMSPEQADSGWVDIDKRSDPTPKRIGYDQEGFRPVAEVWAEYDANRKAANE